MSGRERARRIPFWAIGYAAVAVVWIPVFLAAGGPERVPDLIPYALGSLALAITAGALADRARARRRACADLARSRPATCLHCSHAPHGELCGDTSGPNFCTCTLGTLTT